MLHTIDTPTLTIAYLESGPRDGWPVVLSHGFPYDVHAYDEVATILAGQGARVIVPYLRGYGPTRFRDAATPRSGQQAALAADLLALLDALALETAVVAGYDWGGRAACIVAALWPERVRGLVSVGSYNIQSLASAGEPVAPEIEHRLWYQYYFHAERGRAGLERNRAALCKLLWRLWSPDWAFDDATYARSAVAFENPDFVDVVIQSYRHRFNLVEGDPAFEEIERQLVEQPPVGVPTISFDGDSDGVAAPGGTAHHARQFTGRHDHRVLPGIGHNLPQEAPAAFAEAVATVEAWARAGHDPAARLGK